VHQVLFYGRLGNLRMCECHMSCRARGADRQPCPTCIMAHPQCCACAWNAFTHIAPIFCSVSQSDINSATHDQLTCQSPGFPNLPVVELYVLCDTETRGWGRRHRGVVSRRALLLFGQAVAPTRMHNFSKNSILNEKKHDAIACIHSPAGHSVAAPPLPNTGPSQLTTTLAPANSAHAENGDGASLVANAGAFSVHNAVVIRKTMVDTTRHPHRAQAPTAFRRGRCNPHPVSQATDARRGRYTYYPWCVVHTYVCDRPAATCVTVRQVRSLMFIRFENVRWSEGCRTDIGPGVAVWHQGVGCPQCRHHAAPLESG
jgi:hypothetical protein